MERACGSPNVVSGNTARIIPCGYLFHFKCLVLPTLQGVGRIGGLNQNARRIEMRSNKRFLLALNIIDGWEQRGDAGKIADFLKEADTEMDVELFKVGITERQNYVFDLFLNCYRKIEDKALNYAGQSINGYLDVFYFENWVEITDTKTGATVKIDEGVVKILAKIIKGKAI